MKLRDNNNIKPGNPTPKYGFAKNGKPKVNKPSKSEPTPFLEPAGMFKVNKRRGW